jgi:hypothetical protein
LRENPALCLEIENATRRATGLPELQRTREFDLATAISGEPVGEIEYNEDEDEDEIS